MRKRTFVLMETTWTDGAKSVGEQQTATTKVCKSVRPRGTLFGLETKLSSVELESHLARQWPTWQSVEEVVDSFQSW